MVSLMTMKVPSQEMSVASSVCLIQPKQRGIKLPDLNDARKFNSSSTILSESSTFRSQAGNLAKMKPLMTRKASSPAFRINSNAWLGPLKSEIQDPDVADPSKFDDAEEGDYPLHPSDESQVSALNCMRHSSNDSGMSTLAIAAASLLDPSRTISNGSFQSQPWEYDVRETSLFVQASRPILSSSTSKIPIVSSSIDKFEADFSRKRKALTTSSMPICQKKRDLTKPPSPSSLTGEIEEVYEIIDVAEEDIGPQDVLGGRGGLSNHHEGNKRFRQIVADMKRTYRKTGVKTEKTALARAIVEYVHKAGGRFLIKKNEGEHCWRLMTPSEARKKTSQALRETKELKWTVSPNKEDK